MNDTVEVAGVKPPDTLMLGLATNISIPYVWGSCGILGLSHLDPKAQGMKTVCKHSNPHPGCKSSDTSSGQASHYLLYDGTQIASESDCVI